MGTNRPSLRRVRAETLLPAGGRMVDAASSTSCTIEAMRQRSEQTGQDLRVRGWLAAVLTACLAGACTSGGSDTGGSSTTTSAVESSTTVATNPVTPVPLENRIVDVRVSETSVEVEFSHGVPEHQVSKGDVPTTGDCSPTPMPGADEFVNVVMNVNTEYTPNGLPPGLEAVTAGTGVIELVALTCAFEAQVHMAIGLSAAATLQGYQAVVEDGPPRLVIHITAAARD